MAATAQSTPNIRRRGADRGIILITTLLLLTLLAGFAIAAQNRALGQALALDAVQEVEDERVVLQSVRAVALPVVGEALSVGDAEQDMVVSFAERRILITVSPLPRSGWASISIGSVPQ